MTRDPIIVFPGEPHEMIFRWIPPGRFRMGSRGYDADEQPPHWVTIPQGYWMGETPVTQGQYRFLAEQCAGALAAIEGHRGPEPSHFAGHDHHPVEKVNWHEARAVAAWLTRSGLLGDPDLRAHLPTEAQWEHACRAGTTTEYSSGDGEAALAEVGWYGSNAGVTTHPVKGKPANAFGLYDLQGNVWEWCQDRWDESAYRKRGVEWIDRYEEDGEDSTNRVIRGGSWVDTARYCRAAFRFWILPTNRGRDVGFRLCVSSGSGETGTGPEARRAERAPGGGGADERSGGWGRLVPPRSGGEFLEDS